MNETSTAPRREFQFAEWPLAAMRDSNGDASGLADSPHLSTL